MWSWLPAIPGWLPNLLSLAGIVLLFVPARAANKVARRLSRLRGQGVHPHTDPRLAARRLRAIMRYLTGWSRRDSLCLWLGYGCLVLGTSLGPFV